MIGVFSILFFFQSFAYGFTRPYIENRVPSNNPLKYINLEIISESIFEQFPKTALGTILPVDANDAVAIFIAEGCSGFLGGVVGKVTAIISRDRNFKDSSLSAAGISGAYFGVTAAVRTLFGIVGASTLFESLIAFSLASIISEFIKYQSRSIAPLQTKVGNGPTMFDLMRFSRPKMKDMMKFSREGIFWNIDISISTNYFSH